MKLDRLETIINCYGNDPSRWPPDERQAALDLIHSASAQALQASTTGAAQLDAWLASDASLTYPQQLQHRIAQSTTEKVLGSIMHGGPSTTKSTTSLLERFFAWLLPDPTGLSHSFEEPSTGEPIFWRNSVWKSGLVACLPLVVGMVLGNFTTSNISTAVFTQEERSLEEQLEEQQEELYLLALTDQTPQQWSADWMEE